MKHLFLLIFLVVAGYAVWHVSNPIERRHATRFLTRHGLRLGGLFLVVFGLLAAAFYFPATSIL